MGYHALSHSMFSMPSSQHSKHPCDFITSAKAKLCRCYICLYILGESLTLENQTHG